VLRPRAIVIGSLFSTFRARVWRVTIAGSAAVLVAGLCLPTTAMAAVPTVQGPQSNGSAGEPLPAAARHVAKSVKPHHGKRLRRVIFPDAAPLPARPRHVVTHVVRVPMAADTSSPRDRPAKAGVKRLATMSFAGGTTLSISPAAVSTLAGSGSAGVADGTGAAASFGSPQGLHVVGGYGYVFDSGYLRRVTLATGVVATVAGTGSAGYSDSTDPFTATVSGSGVMADDGSYLYFTNGCGGYGDLSCLRRMNLSTGAISTLNHHSIYSGYTALVVAGDGALYGATGDGLESIDTTTGVGTALSTSPSATWTTVSAMTSDDDFLWLSVSGGSWDGPLARIDLSTGALTSPTSDAGAAGLAPLVSAGDYLYGSRGYQVVRYAKATGQTVVIAGQTGSTAGFVNGTGGQAWFGTMSGLDSDGTRLYVSDVTNHRVRALDAGTTLARTQPPSLSATVTIAPALVSIFAGSGTAAVVDGTGTAASFNSPAGLHVVAGSGYLFDSGYLRRVDMSTGVVQTVAGTGTTGYTDSVNPATATLNGPGPMTDDGTFLYFTNTCGGYAEYSCLRRMSLSTGAISTMAQRSTFDAYTALVIGPDGALYGSAGADVERIDTVNNTTTTVVTVPPEPGHSDPNGTYYLSIQSMTADQTSLWVNTHEELSGALYSECCTSLLKINPADGQVTTVLHDDDISHPHGTGHLVSAGGYLYGTYRGQVQGDGSSASGIARWEKATGTMSTVVGGIALAQTTGLEPFGSSLFAVDRGSRKVLKLVQAPAVAQGGPTLPFEGAGGGSPSEHVICKRCAGEPIDLDTGSYFDSVADLQVPGRGPALNFSRTYDSARAALAGRLGNGWTDSYDWQVTLDTSGGPSDGQATVRQSNGSQTLFAPDGSGNFVAASRVLATLTHNSDGTWTYTVRKTTTYTFASTGNLTRIADLNGYHTDLAYDGSGRLSTVTDPAGRTLTLAYDTSNRVHTVTDPLSRVVTYTYTTSNDLHTVLDADGRTWTYTDDTAHQVTAIEDPRGNSTSNHFNPAGQVTYQIDRRGKETDFAYGAPTTDGHHTTLVTHPAGNQDQYLYYQAMAVQTINGYGSVNAATWQFAYDPDTLGLTQTIDPNGHTSSATYDAAGNQLTGTDAKNRTTTWTYNSYNEPLTRTDPLGVTTTVTYDTTFNPLTSSTPLVGSSPAVSQTTSNTYGDGAHPGDVTKTTDPDNKDTIYTYDTNGDVASVTDATARKTSYTYNAIGWQLTEVTPAGNATGGTPSQHTITLSDFTGFGTPQTVTDQLGHASTYDYDADQNQTDVTDADLRVTHTDYNENNQPTLVTRPGSITQATGYDDNGNMASQTDGLTHATTYGYDALDRVTSVTDPLSRVSSATYDGVGNMLTSTRPGTPTGTLVTTGTYDPADERTGISYSDGTTHSVAYTYDADSQRATMVDATGTTTYTVDSLHRLTATTNGAGRTVGYGYDIGNRLSALTYPGAKVLTRGFDDAGRLTSTTDWLSTPTTNTFGYDDDGNWTTTTYGNTDTATRTVNRADQITALTYQNGATTLATLTYTRTDAGLLATTTPSAGAPGATDTYTRNPRAQLTSPDNTGTTWAYDAADRITKLTGGTTLAYDTADQLTTSTPTTGPATTYTYDNRGQRTAALVTGAGSSTTQTYNQAGNLTATTPAGGATTTYGYDGDGLRANKTPAGGSIAYMAWDAVTNTVPLLLNDDDASFIYGPNGTPVEQVKGTTNTYPMGDQLGSTVLLTGSTGAVTGTWTYNAYGATTSHTLTGTTPLLYNGQYQDTETNLYYLRARYYDPTTAQFLTADPLTPQTRNRYTYAGGSPLDNTDPAGLESADEEGGHPVPGPSNEGGDFGLGDGASVADGAASAAEEELEAVLDTPGALRGELGTCTPGEQLLESTTAAEEASVAGRRLGAAYADETPSLGNLKRMSESQLKRYGIDAHQLKDEMLGGSISKFDIYRHGDDLYFVEKSTGEVVPAYTTLER
jgi:RHS repeat-associated protein